MVLNYLIYLYNLPKNIQIKQILVIFAIFIVLFITFGIFQYISIKRDRIQ